MMSQSIKVKLRALVLSVFFLCKLCSVAHAQTVDYSVHANIIYHITKYMQWPVNKSQPDFVIGIIGETPLYDELQKATLNKAIGNQKIIVKHISASQSAYTCQIIFISEDESRSLKTIADQTQSSPVLIITEKTGLALKGACINFIIDDDHLKLEINKNNIEQRNLKIASELLSLGVIVNNKVESSKLSKK
ncbi:MAG: YfiR family protein [Bacteroidia bacterium]